MKPEEVIKSFVENNGIKITYIARKTGMNKDLISKSLNGKRNLKSQEFIDICNVLRLDIKDFLFQKQNE